MKTAEETGTRLCCELNVQYICRICNRNLCSPCLNGECYALKDFVTNACACSKTPPSAVEPPFDIVCPKCVDIDQACLDINGKVIACL